jgi:hypothetical protein
VYNSRRDQIWLRQHVELLNRDGVSTPASRDCLLVFIDETGHERLADPKYPVFGLGGCAVLAKDYDERLAHPWRELKTRHFGGPDTPLHASTSRSLTQAQLEALDRFFRTESFFRVASVLSDKTVLCDGFRPYQVVAPSLRQRIADVARPIDFSRVAMIFEESERTDPLVVQHFASYKLKRVRNSVSTPIPVDGYFMAKSSCEPGLEVADFVMHAAGTYVRARLRGVDDPQRRDFMATFQAVDFRLQSFMEILTAQCTQQPALGP